MKSNTITVEEFIEKLSRFPLTAWVEIGVDNRNFFSNQEIPRSFSYSGGIVTISLQKAEYGD